MSTDVARNDKWSSGDSYERYVGRWSRLVAYEFVRWLHMPENGQWLDVGCGTGALCQTIIDHAKPARVKGIDRSEDYVQIARRNVNSPIADFEIGDAQSLPIASDLYDAAVSGLVLNFVPEPARMLSEMKRAVKTGGTVALYVWDYAGQMQLMRHFWDAATALDPAARELDEGRRFPICNPDPLRALFHDSGLHALETHSIDITTHFRDFDDYWGPFLGGQGPAAGYAMSLSEEQRSQLRDRIYSELPFAPDHSISLIARAWAIKGVK